MESNSSGSDMVKEFARIAAQIDETEYRRETAARRPQDAREQRPPKAQRATAFEDAPRAIERERWDQNNPIEAKRAAAQKRQALLDDLPKCFRRPKEANNVDLYLDNYFKGRDEDLTTSFRLREVLLTGKAVSKELRYDNLSTSDKKLMDVAMKLEWSKWTEFGAYKKLPAKELRELFRKHPGLRPVGTRWVLGNKGPRLMKARLVVQGCKKTRRRPARTRPQARATPST